jgi:hypothetical protein
MHKSNKSDFFHTSFIVNQHIILYIYIHIYQIHIQIFISIHWKKNISEKI